MFDRAKSFATLVFIYCIAWLAAFLFVVGFKPSLIPTYFIQGWRVSGFELVTFVWILAWPIFILLSLACQFFWRPLKIIDKVPPN